MTQINTYKPPPNPAKISDPRAKWYISKFGDTSWELDALSPKILEEIVEAAVVGSLDLVQYEEMLGQELDDKIKLKKIIEQLEEDKL